MSLFPDKDILAKEIESWKGFADCLSSSDDRELLMKMLNDCHKYASAINAKGTPFPTEPLIIALLLSQHKIIEWLTDKILRHTRLTIESVPNKDDQQSSPNSKSDSGNVNNAENDG